MAELGTVRRNELYVQRGLLFSLRVPACCPAALCHAAKESYAKVFKTYCTVHLVFSKYTSAIYDACRFEKY